MRFGAVPVRIPLVGFPVTVYASGSLSPSLAESAMEAGLSSRVVADEAMATGGWFTVVLVGTV